MYVWSVLLLFLLVFALSYLLLSNAWKAFLATFMILILLAAAYAFLPSLFASERQPADENPTISQLLDSYQFTSEDMNIIANDMDQKIVKDISGWIGSTTPNQFIDAYLQEDPAFKSKVADYIEAH